MKTVFLVGGGSGGHVTPLLPIAKELKCRDPHIRVVHIGQKNDPMNSIINEARGSLIDAQLLITAGKFRRYHGESFIKQILDIKTFLLNIRDFFRFTRGYIQARRILKTHKPVVVFSKGGFVGAPVGLAAGKLDIPYVTHDSDAMVSLAHRIIAKRAAKHLTAMQPSLYATYEQSKTVQVGVPVRPEFHDSSPEAKNKQRKELGYTSTDKIVLVTGGGLGAKKNNDAFIEQAEEVLKEKNVRIIHVAGDKLKDEVLLGYQQKGVNMQRVVVLPFTVDLYRYSLVSDLIVTRAGATNIAEFAAQTRCCVVVPSPFLAGGHQLKNAQALQDAGAAVVVQEKELSTIHTTVTALLSDSQKRSTIAKTLHETIKTDAAPKVVDELMKLMR